MSNAPQPSSEPTDWSSDLDAVARLRDRDSFMRIYDHFMPRLCVYLQDLGAAQSAAEELAQDSLLRLWLRASQCGIEPGTLGACLYRIARNLHIDRMRRELSWMQLQTVVEEAALHDMLDLGSARKYADHALLHHTTNELSSVQALILRMSYCQARSLDEISQALNLPRGAVKSHLRCAFLQLQSKVTGSP